MIIFKIDIQSVLLPPKPPYQKQNNREHNTYQDGTSQRKIESSVLAPIQDVARKPSKREACPPEQHDDAPDYHQGYSEYYQHPSYFRHASSLTPPLAQLHPRYS